MTKNTTSTTAAPKLVAVQTVQPRKQGLGEKGRYGEKTYRVDGMVLGTDIVEPENLDELLATYEHLTEPDADEDLNDVDAENVAEDEDDESDDYDIDDEGYANFTAMIRSSDNKIVREGASQLLHEANKVMAGIYSRTPMTYEQMTEAAGTLVAEMYDRVHVGKVVNKKVIQSVGNKIPSRIINEGVRHETKKAIGLLKQAIDEAERVGVSYTKREVSLLAKEMRVGSNFNPRNRPEKGFEKYLAGGNTSLDAYSETFADEVMEDSGYGRGTTYVGEGSVADQMLEAREVGNLSLAQTRRNFYPAVAVAFDAPAPVSDLFTEKEGRKVAATLRNQEDVLDACSDFMFGYKTDGSDALFAPFGNITQSAKEDFVEMVRARADYAHELWESALHLATEGAEKRTRRLV
ncbi:hypothetical protein [Leifsonia sp. Leaf264]|uniref:hypothetical protein n=1 Tax=Leifsonia sp. Leaf264 TaxID=1736314 RepID=UPI0006F83A2E|nr:hypothetical protein [Leifsonia sp. Leaf264]KQO98843.1 hypothetical protein ASF30_12330 [Leifsonia sp. Leaf264]